MPTVKLVKFNVAEPAAAIWQVTDVSPPGQVLTWFNEVSMAIRGKIFIKKLLAKKEDLIIITQTNLPQNPCHITA